MVRHVTTVLLKQNGTEFGKKSNSSDVKIFRLYLYLSFLRLKSYFRYTKSLSFVRFG